MGGSTSSEFEKSNSSTDERPSFPYTKILLIVAGGLCVAGITLSAVGASMGSTTDVMFILGVCLVAVGMVLFGVYAWKRSKHNEFQLVDVSRFGGSVYHLDAHKHTHITPYEPNEAGSGGSDETDMYQILNSINDSEFRKTMKNITQEQVAHDSEYEGNGAHVYVVNGVGHFLLVEDFTVQGQVYAAMNDDIAKGLPLISTHVYFPEWNHKSYYVHQLKITGYTSLYDIIGIEIHEHPIKIANAIKQLIDALSDQAIMYSLEMLGDIVCCFHNEEEFREGKYHLCLARVDKLSQATRKRSKEELCDWFIERIKAMVLFDNQQESGRNELITQLDQYKREVRSP
jgi:hypothetical protein